MDIKRYKNNIKVFLYVTLLILISLLSFSIGRHFPIVTKECILDSPGTYASEDGRYYLSLPPESSNDGFYLTCRLATETIVNSGEYEKISNTLATMKTKETTMYLYETTIGSKKGIVLVDELRKEIFLTKESNSYVHIDKDGNFSE